MAATQLRSLTVAAMASVLLAAGQVACSRVTPTVPSDQTFLLSGTVRDALTLDPLSDAAVRLTSATGTLTSQTGADGRFAFAGVRGTVTLMVLLSGYEPFTTIIEITEPTSPIDVPMRRIPDNAPASCGESPGAGNRTVPLFSRPFDGDFQLTNYFDHDLPLGNSPGNGFQLTFCDERVGGRIDGHEGYDWLLPTGTQLMSVAEGQVINAGTDPPFFCAALGRTVTDQKFVEIRHPVTDGEVVSSVFVHLSRVDVVVGQSVTRGQVIGLSGNSGCSTEPHLHLQVWRFTNTNNGRPTLIDPYGWDGTSPDPWAQYPSGSRSLWLWQPGQAPSIRSR